MLNDLSGLHGIFNVFNILSMDHKLIKIGFSFFILKATMESTKINTNFKFSFGVHLKVLESFITFSLIHLNSVKR